MDTDKDAGSARFSVGQQVRLRVDLAGAANNPAGTVGTVTEILPREVRVQFDKHLGRITPDMIEAV